MRTNIEEAFIDSVEEPQAKSRCVVRLTTSTWHDRAGLYQRKTLRFMKRLCVEFNVLEEDAANFGAEEVVPRITNLATCPDGLYEVVTCHESRDYETGIIDDYDYKLIPFALDPAAPNGA
jgi:hypothetical protein